MQWQPVISLSLSDIEAVSWPLSSRPGVVSYTLKDQDFMCQPCKPSNVGVRTVEHVMPLNEGETRSRTRAIVLTGTVPNMWMSFRRGMLFCSPWLKPGAIWGTVAFLWSPASLPSMTSDLWHQQTRYFLFLGAFSVNPWRWLWCRESPTSAVWSTLLCSWALLAQLANTNR